MAEVYTVVLNNQTPVEITGGRVGNFLMGTPLHGATWLGASNLSITYPSGSPSISNGAYMATTPKQLNVTSPDEIYALIEEYAGGVLTYFDLVIFHNR